MLLFVLGFFVGSFADAVVATLAAAAAIVAVLYVVVAAAVVILVVAAAIFSVAAVVILAPVKIINLLSVSGFYRWKIFYLCTFLFSFQGIAHRATCQCPPGQTGNPYETCNQKECEANSDCPPDHACVNKICQNPCAVLNPCDPSEVCKVLGHEPNCKCPPGQQGDRYGTCKTGEKNICLNVSVTFCASCSSCNCCCCCYCS